ncbi:hypothetical protein C923_00947 [Plasmodium falciparum UGT5.1]|uniref:Uncharacterized protein n=1 Tax=Plasmodium falciparum UGT5.1 TaxID=1237627 RepID=W7JTG8_PLAFA|nr:hypothetical protein C923_00947 [Plasmodium falciparum UGT5.1]
MRKNYIKKGDNKYEQNNHGVNNISEKKRNSHVNNTIGIENEEKSNINDKVLVIEKNNICRRKSYSDISERTKNENNEISIIRTRRRTIDNTPRENIYLTSKICDKNELLTKFPNERNISKDKCFLKKMNNINNNNNNNKKEVKINNKRKNITKSYVNNNCKLNHHHHNNNNIKKNNEYKCTHKKEKYIFNTCEINSIKVNNNIYICQFKDKLNKVHKHFFPIYKYGDASTAKNRAHMLQLHVCSCIYCQNGILCNFVEYYML